MTRNAPPQPAPAGVPPVADTVLRTPGDTVGQAWDRLSAHLATAGLVLDRDWTPRQFRGGYGNLNYLIRLDIGWAVLRRPPPGRLPPGANDMGREYRVLRVLGPAWPLAPRAYHYCDDPGVIGAPFLISECRDGRTMHGRHPLGAAMTPGLARDLALLQADILASLHELDIEAIGGDGLGRRGDFAARTRAGWRKRLMHGTDTPPRPALALFDWLDAQSPRDDRVAVMHNDFKLDNVLVDPDRPTEARAVLDWDMATLGSPFFDLATLLTYWTSPDDPESLRAINLTHSESAGAVSRADLVARYCRQASLDIDAETDELRFFLALAFAKFGTVLIQLHNRYLRDPDDAEAFRKFGDGIEDAFVMGHAALRGDLF